MSEYFYVERLWAIEFCRFGGDLYAKIVQNKPEHKNLLGLNKLMTTEQHSNNSIYQYLRDDKWLIILY